MASRGVLVALCGLALAAAALATECAAGNLDAESCGFASVTPRYSLRTLTFYGFVGLLVIYTIMEQLRFQKMRVDKTGKPLPGPRATIPFFGGLFTMVLNPFAFWDKQKKYGPLSWNSLVGHFLVFSRDTDTTRKIFNGDGPKMKMFLHYNAEKILGSNNIAFMQGERHKELRKQLLPLFTKSALALYVSQQEKLIREHLEEWIKIGKPFETRPFVRHLNMQTSQTVFVGPYLDDKTRAEFTENYRLMTEGFLTFPINLPGTALWKGIRGRKKVVAILEDCARASKARMRRGEPPACLLDFWMEQMVAAIDKAIEQNLPMPEHHEDYEIACTVLDFLFASQDASTASLVWTVAFLHDYPDVLRRVRDEQDALRPNDEPVNTALADMRYTRQVIKEILRARPPATMVPQITLEDFPLTETYTIPKGTIVIPSIWSSCEQGFTEPEKFDPDRFSPERQEDVKFRANYLPFGTGPHACLGKEYAQNHLMAFAAILARNFEWKRTITPKSHEIVYGPTIYPADCIISLSRRNVPTVSAKSSQTICEM